MIGMIFMGIAIILIANSVDIKMLYLGAVLLGFGESQVSGALFPWFVNTMGEEEKEKKNFIITANAQKQYFTNIIGIMTGFSISIFDFDYKAILILAGILHIGNGILLYAFFEDNKSSDSNLVNIGKKSLEIFWKDFRLWGYTVAMTVSFSFHTVYLFIWQPVANSLGITGSRLGIVQSIYLACLAVSGLLLKYQKNIKRELYIFATFCVPFSLILMYHSKNLMTYMLGMIVLGLSNGMLLPQIMGSIHYFIPDEFRSSVLSLVSSLSSIFLVVLQIGIGEILDNKGSFQLEALCVFFGIVYLICMTLIQKWLKEQENKMTM